MIKTEINMLKRIAAGHTLFTEYNDESEWKLAFALRAKGLVDGRSLLTGTARFTVTEAGKALLSGSAPRE